jgi:tryptophan-rich sensory protein
METYSWYQQLLKPSWAPPSWLFGPVWSVLYLIIAITYGTVLYKVATKQLPAIVAVPFILNLIFNFAFTPIQFGLRNNALATVDILFTLITLIWVIVAIYPHIRWVALANIPYLGWVLFASVLQITITYMNWK